MSKALFDRTTLYLVSDYLHGGVSESTTVAYENIIYATILWDEICVCESGSSTSADLFSKILIGGETFEILSRNGIQYISSLSETDYNEIESALRKYNPDEKEYIISLVTDVLYYQHLSHAINADLFMSLRRQKVLERYGLLNKNTFNRLQPIVLIEEDILQYYLDFQKKYGIEGIQINTPLLIDYVVSQSKDKKDALKVAKQISSEVDVIAFRKAMDDLEICISEKRIMEVDQYLKAINDIVPDLVEKYTSKKVRKAKINLQFNIPYSFGGELEGLNVSFPDSKQRRSIQFLIQLSKYGLLRKHEPIFSIRRFLYNRFDSLYEKYVFKHDMMNRL